ncbi:MAG TPA: hypothetical protein ENG91_05495 [Desulfobacteraceae bacterium]|nr:hypothetical protein BMS3Abin13_00363 [bacterium BMS3Abin13]HDK43987.1 hypothetical protein [Desulfobacteraceae bacterium]
MFKRYIYTIFGVVLLFIVYALTLLPILAVRSTLADRELIFALILWGIGAGVFFMPAMATIIKKTWFFPGRGEPVVQELLLSMIMGVNGLNAPVQAKKHRKKLVITWRYKDQAWCERMEKSGMKKLYELWLSFDNNTKTVTLTDKFRSVDWSLGPGRVKTGWLASSRPIFKVAMGNEWGVENYEDTEPDDYAFGPEEIKGPIMNTILKNGWNVRFSLF